MKGEGFLKRLAVSDSEIKYYTAGRAQYIGTLGRSYDKISKIQFLPDILLRSAYHSLPGLHSFYRPLPMILSMNGIYGQTQSKNNNKITGKVFHINLFLISYLFSPRTGLMVAARQLCSETDSREMIRTAAPEAAKIHQSRVVL